MDGKSVELVRMGGSEVDIDPLVDLTDDIGWGCVGCIEGSPEGRPYVDWGGPCGEYGEGLGLCGLNSKEFLVVKGGNVLRWPW